jgi:beta-lactamase class A
MPKKNSPKRRKAPMYLLIFGFLFLGFLLGLIFAHVLFPETIHPSLLLRESGYEYINPLIDFDNIDFIKTREAKNLQKELNNFVHAEIQDNPNITHISVYYRDLNTGVWIGINEKEKFALASLTKIPLMIAHYKMAEKDPQHLEQKYIYSFDEEAFRWVLDDNRYPKYQLEEGKEYTLDDFINQLVIHSNNTVLPFLSNDNYGNYVDKIYFDLGITNPYLTEDENAITVREYSSFFRILYNATYLSKEMSSKALELLSRSSYDLGLAKGIPEDIVLANKFGERNYETEEGVLELKQIHDCGIIYHPEKPYVLCVMTRGLNQPIQRRAISEISSIVYKRVDGK